MSDKLKCSECTRLGRPCVSVSWGSLDKSRESLKASLSRDEEERDRLLERLAELQARLARNRKVLEQTNERAAAKLNCLVQEMEADGEDMTQTVIDASALEFELFPPAGSSSMVVQDSQNG